MLPADSRIVGCLAMATGAVLIGAADGDQVNMVAPMAQTLRSTRWMPPRCVMTWRMEDGAFNPAIRIRNVGGLRIRAKETDVIERKSQTINSSTMLIRYADNIPLVRMPAGISTASIKLFSITNEIHLVLLCFGGHINYARTSLRYRGCC